MSVHITPTIKDKIFGLLRLYGKYRDNDLKLYARFIYDHYLSQNRDVKKITLYEFLCDLSEGKIEHFESIRRTRQKIQEEHPELRGKVYKKRQEKTEEIKQELGYHVKTKENDLGLH